MITALRDKPGHLHPVAQGAQPGPEGCLRAAGVKGTGACLVVDCPVCGDKTSRVFEKHNYWICECRRCRHRTAELHPGPDHLAQVYGDHYFTSGGAGYADYIGEAEIVYAQGEYYGKLLRRFTELGNVLDVGAAAGFFLRGLQSVGWKGVGIEPNVSMAEYGRSRGIDLRVGAIESFSTGLQFDLISMIQVVAHFYDVRLAFEKAAELTRMQGHWLVETWNKDSWTARLLGKRWHEYSPPSVINWFSPNTLAQLAGKFGFEEIARGRPPKKLKAAHLKAFVNFKLGSSKIGKVTNAILKAVPDNSQIPYPSEDLFWMLLQRRS